MPDDRPRPPRPGGSRPGGSRNARPGSRPGSGRPSSGGKPRPGSGDGRPSYRRADGEGTRSTGGPAGGAAGSGRRDGRKPYRAGDDKPRGAGRPGQGRPGQGRPGSGRSGAGRGRPGDDGARRGERPTRPEPRNEAERRAAEVRARRAPRTPVDPDQERLKIEARQTEQWIDEGSLRDAAEQATARAATHRVRRDPEVDPEVVAEIHSSAIDSRRATRLAERVASAAGALDRERYDDVRRMVAPVIRELPLLAAGHELNGLANYGLGRWRQAAESLEQARQLHSDPALLPVLADCYRALKRWTAVDAVWTAVREASPSHEVMAEARIVVAGAHADRGELREAIAVLQPAQKAPKKVREHHLRQWYVLADLLDRAGDTIGASRWFREVMAHDPSFADVRERVRSLGR